MKIKARSENFHGRPDWHTRALVEAGLELRRRGDVRSAAEFMRAHRVPLQITVRILSYKIVS